MSTWMRIRSVKHRGLRRFIEEDDPSGLQPAVVDKVRNIGSTGPRSRSSIWITRTTTREAGYDRELSTEEPTASGRLRARRDRRTTWTFGDGCGKCARGHARGVVDAAERTLLFVA